MSLNAEEFLTQSDESHAEPAASNPTRARAACAYHAA